MTTKKRALGSRLEATPSNDQGAATDGGVRLVPAARPPARRRRRPSKGDAKEQRAELRLRYAEARCVVCGCEVTSKARTTSGAIQALYVRCVREGWRTLILPKGGRGSRRRMVCRRCSGAIRLISRFMPARTAIRYDTW